MRCKFVIALLAWSAVLASGGTTLADIVGDPWAFAQLQLAPEDPRLLDWTQDIARIEITTSVIGTRGQPPRVGFKVLEVLRAGYFPAPKSAIWLGDNVAGGADWSTHVKNGTLDVWEAEALKAPPVGTRALVLTMFDGEATLFNADGFFPDTLVNRNTASRLSATEPWSQAFANSMLFAVPVLLLAALALLRKRPGLAFLFAAITFAAFAFYNSHIPISSNIRVDLVVLYPVLWLSGATMAGALVLIAWRHRKQWSGN